MTRSDFGNCYFIDDLSVCMHWQLVVICLTCNEIFDTAFRSLFVNTMGFRVVSIGKDVDISILT